MELPRKVLVIGSGAIKIAEAAEFDYSGSQALKALKEEGIETVLVNPNIATIQTDHSIADKVYLVPLKPEFVEKVIERERPDAILLGFGGQTALSLGVKLYRAGVLDRYGVKVLGTPVEGIEKALNREAFRKTMIEHGLPAPPSGAARSVEEALEVAKSIGFPVIVRISFNLGGRGSFVAWSEEELAKRLGKAFAHSEIGLVLIEKYLHHWKEIEFEVVRDAYGNSVAVACLENVDPMGIHTGESVVVAPCQTLNDEEYQVLRLASIGVANAITLIGEGNVQLALDPETGRYFVIETNPRMSRSSALASKATGYPLAYIATKLALGYRLHEILNTVTKMTTACFEPSLDYVVVKIPRWDLSKFPYVSKSIGSEMMSVGEVMAIGRNLAEAMQKAVRMLDIGEPGVIGPWIFEKLDVDEVLEKLRSREPYWVINVAKALWLGLSVEEIKRVTGIDHFFINVIKEIVDTARELLANRGRDLESLEPLVARAKELGFSDEQIAMLLGVEERVVREFRRRSKLKPFVKRVDTLAAEWPAKTNYLYLTYDASESDCVEHSGRKRVLVLGAGTFRIGVSVEFDWATVNIAKALRDLGYEVSILNYNPETVSTDWDFSDKLYFDEITLERVLDVYEIEKPVGVVTFVGGQIANNLAKKLEDEGVPLLGTSGSSIDVAEDRAKFSKLLDELGVAQPPWIEARDVRDVISFAESVGYPVLVRPSYVIGGLSMYVARSREELEEILRGLMKAGFRGSIVVSKFIDNALEAEIDAVSDSRSVLGVVIEHIEKAGVHSGDATLVTPTRRLSDSHRREMERIALDLARALKIVGPFNIQFLVKDRVYVLELNLRASRSMPFSSKSRGVNLMRIAAKILAGERLGFDGFKEPPAQCWAVKTPQFSWAQLRGAYPFLSPEMRSTGEVAAFGWCFESALLKSWASATPNEILKPGDAVLIYTYEHRAKPVLSKAASTLCSIGTEVLTLDDDGCVDGCSKPVSRKAALEALKHRRIALLITSGYTPERDYDVRRLAADLNIPMILSEDLALEIARAHAWLFEGGELDVAEMRNYWSSSAKDHLFI